MPSSKIQYSTSWEDADLLLHATRPSKGARILSIGASGDNAFSLLSTSPSEVIAIDSNPHQLYLIELKKIALKHLDYTGYLEFIGIKPSTQRLAQYSKFKEELSDAARSFWDQNPIDITHGVIHVGKFEGYLRMFGKHILKAIHRQSTIESLMEEKTGVEQTEFYNDRWNTLKWKLFERDLRIR